MNRPEAVIGTPAMDVISDAGLCSMTISRPVEMPRSTDELGAAT